MNFPLFIAKRLYSGRDVASGDESKQDGNVSSFTINSSFNKIATAGVAIGLAVMIVSVSVVLGFKHTIRDKVMGFGSHIVVASFRSVQGLSDEPIAVNDSLMRLLSNVRGVSHAQRYALKQGMLKTDTDFLGIMLKGVTEEYDTTFLHTCLAEGRLPRFSDTAASGEVLVSRTMADKLRLKSGDRVFAYFMGDDNLRARRLTVTGVYKTDMSYFDNTYAFTDMYSVRRLNGWNGRQVSGVELIVSDIERIPFTEEAIIYGLSPRVDADGNMYTPQTIQRRYPQIFAWLDLLDVNVWIILALMMCVAAVTMISGLLIIILERTSMIGVLKALGARDATVRRTFIWLAAFIIGRALLIGDVIGIGIVLVQRLTGLVKLDASTYYVDTVPVEINIPLIILINIATLIINVLVLVAPSFIISHVNPAKSMRFE